VNEHPPLDSGRNTQGGDWLSLESVRLEAAGLHLEGVSPRDQWRAGGVLAASPALTAHRFEVELAPLPGSDLTSKAGLCLEHMRLEKAPAGEPTPLAFNWKDGRATVDITNRDLERILVYVLTEFLRPHHTAISGAAVTLKVSGPRSLQCSARMTFGWHLFNATIDASLDVAIDDGLNLRLSAYQVQGQGFLGSVLAALVRAPLEGFQDRSFALGAPILGSIRLTDIHWRMADNLRVTLAFLPAHATAPGSWLMAGLETGLQISEQPQRKPKQCDVYVIDTGHRLEATQVLKETFLGDACLLNHNVYVLTGEQSAAVLRNNPQFRLQDPIVLVLDSSAVVEERSNGYGFRANLGAAANRSEMVQIVKLLQRLLADRSRAADVVAAARAVSDNVVGRGLVSMVSGS
jgi:hypothetical protein